MKIVKHIPNTITSMNLLCGVLGVYLVLGQGRADLAFLLMLLAAVFDFFDGFAARALNAYSPMGKELDSLADMVSFGVLPSVMLCDLYSSSIECGLPWKAVLPFIPLAIAVFSGLRLAKFNIDERQTENFIGLATPACAMICGSLVYYVGHEEGSFFMEWCRGPVFIPLLSIVLCALLVSEIPMFSMKFKKGVNKKAAYYRLRLTFIGVIAVSSVLVWLMNLNWTMIVFLSFICYIIMNLLHAAFGNK